MDPFQSLPAEIRLQVVESIDMREDVAALSLASSAVFQQCQADRMLIKRTFVSRDLDNGLIDDAMAIIGFPRWNLGLEGRKPVIHAHLKRWAIGGLSTEPRKADILLLLKLDALCQYIWLYIDDFLSKTTSRSLPKAYKPMPRIPRKPTAAGFTKRGLIWPWQCRRFDVTKLTRGEKVRIFRAFLHYEILCKIYGPQREERTNFLQKPSPSDNDAFQGTNNLLRPFNYWTWDILSHYRTAQASEADLELLATVREYLLTIYYGLISSDLTVRRAKIKHPEFENSPFLNPNDFVKCHKTDRLISMMASGGFDLVTSMFRLDRCKLKPFLKRFSDSLTTRKPNVDVSHPVIKLPRELRGHTQDWWNCDGFTRLMRQRAKALFEDNRFYPGIGRLPTFDEYKECCRLRGFSPPSNPIDPAGTQFIAYGAITYNCLGNKLNPFWDKDSY